MKTVKLFDAKNRFSELCEYRDFLENRLVLLPVDKPVADVFGEIP